MKLFVNMLPLLVLLLIQNSSARPDLHDDSLMEPLTILRAPDEAPASASSNAHSTVEISNHGSLGTSSAISSSSASTTVGKGSAKASATANSKADAVAQNFHRVSRAVYIGVDNVGGGVGYENKGAINPGTGGNNSGPIDSHNNGNSGYSIVKSGIGGGNVDGIDEQWILKHRS
ncbi:hypothetical protein KPH14_003782 [Odynerus spinipes]|uniref:Uncharacterized protein n=1 Tax=Odynerus spinipes TaxID=1348599 RepID=A0AAD9RXB2_9HYME|nr:hypothetical protein KPH14_003782 [Odynerus spinipes]